MVLLWYSETERGLSRILTCNRRTFRMCMITVSLYIRFLFDQTNLSVLHNFKQVMFEKRRYWFSKYQRLCRRKTGPKQQNDSKFVVFLISSKMKTFKRAMMKTDERSNPHRTPNGIIVPKRHHKIKRIQKNRVELDYPK